EIPNGPPGRGKLRLVLPGSSVDAIDVPVRGIPGWLALVPPALAILLALLFRQVLPALAIAVWVGATIVYGGPLVGLLRWIDHYAVNAIVDRDHTRVLLFSLLLGGMVGVMLRSGGTNGLVDSLRGFATSRRRGQLTTWGLGLFVFFDDYANSLLVGNTMRPVTDRLRISREKLAFLVDSTAAPVASIFLVSTWIGFEVSLIGDALTTSGSDLDPYVVFLRSLPYNFYPVLALAFGLMLCSTGRDFGPMREAEKRALSGHVLREGSTPLADFDHEDLKPVGDKPHRLWNAVVPVASVLIVTFVSLWLSGRAGLIENGDPDGTRTLGELGWRGLGNVLGAGSSYDALLYASLSGCLVAIALPWVQRILSLAQAVGAWIAGVRGMMMAFVILALAWCISAVCQDLHAADYMVNILSDRLHPGLLPAIVFMIAAATAFATGAAWGTMGILIPLAVPSAFALAQSGGYSVAGAESILLATISSVLAGAIFGDHCSPISDTTVLSSMASACDHVDHVRTQMPYAMVVAGVALVFGYIPAGLGFSPWLSLIASALTLFGILRLVGRPTGTHG
ncbi:MAG: Na+/H+ antiporter NhaC family protein, partial [Acidobacteriota bacterium]|nr:Na+/H+ antiporter NhaC family protein [Acidobacteriota bacterium]